MLKIIDFWESWNKLSNLKQWAKNIKSSIIYVQCSKWNSSSRLDKYTKKIFGYNISQVKDQKRIQEDIELRNKYFNKIQWKEEIMSELQCQIWFNLIDLDINLQWVSCTKIYWFDWLLDWMLQKSTCPNWRISLTKSSIHPNKEWKKFVEILKAESEKIKEPICIIHKIESNLYWIECNSCVWIEWVINKKHSFHTLIKIDEILEQLNIKVEEELSQKSTVKSCLNTLRMINNHCDIAEVIINEVIGSYIQYFTDASKVLDFHIIQILKSSKDKLNIILEKWILNEEQLIKYRDSKDKRLICQTTAALSNADNQRKEIKDLINNTVEQCKSKELYL